MIQFNSISAAVKVVRLDFFECDPDRSESQPDQDTPRKTADTPQHPGLADAQTKKIQDGDLKALGVIK